jgi:integration host factor subunit alpha
MTTTVENKRNTLTRAQIAENVYERANLPRPEAEKLVDQFFAVIRDTLLQGETVKLVGFGQFTVRRKNARPARNPRTGESAVVTARQVVTFKASHKLKEKMPTTEQLAPETLQ